MEENKRVFTGIWIPRFIYLNKDVKWIEKILFLEIHSFTANGKSCYMSNEYMSSFLGISVRQVSRIITKLKKIGWIEESFFDGRKRHLRSCMKINMQTGEADTTIVSCQTRQKCLGSIDENVQHIKTITKPINSFLKKEELDTPKFNANPRKK